MKIESRGKYAGVKVHLDEDECTELLNIASHSVGLSIGAAFAIQMGKMIHEKLEENPELLDKRTPEQIAAILAKEVEKAKLQLDAIEHGKDWKKVDGEALKKALLKHVPKEG